MNEVMGTFGLPSLNQDSFSMHKKAYVAPVVAEEWKEKQGKLIDKIKAKIAQVPNSTTLLLFFPHSLHLSQS